MLDFSHNNLFEFTFQDKEKFIRTRNTEVGMIVKVVLSPKDRKHWETLNQRKYAMRFTMVSQKVNN